MHLRRGVGAFKSKAKTVDKKQKYSLRETDKRLKRLARRMTGKYNIIIENTVCTAILHLGPVAVFPVRIEVAVCPDAAPAREQ